MRWLDQKIISGPVGRFLSPRREPSETRVVPYPYHDVRHFSLFLVENKLSSTQVRQILWDNGLKSSDVRKGIPIRLPVERPSDTFSRNPYL